MPDITITVKPSFEEVAKRFDRIDLEKAIQEGIERFAFGIERYSKIRSPIDTGRLRASITTDIGNLRARIAPHVDYALFVHEGTKFMRSRPFMELGLGDAKTQLFQGGSNNPFTSAIMKEIKSKL